MNFVNPTGLLFGLLAIPIIALYLLKIRRRELEISSTMLWQMVLRDRQANAPWQKLRRNLLLLLQLVILSGLVLAAARLAFPNAAIASGSVVIILDGSASMLTQEGAQTRFDLALAAADRLARETESGSKITALLANQQPAILFAAETDKNSASSGLLAAAASTGKPDWNSAFALAAGIGSQEQNENLTYVVISDGGLPQSGLTPLPGEVRFVPVGQDGDNLAIDAFESRPLPGLFQEGAELFVRLTNYGAQDRTAILQIARDGEALTSRQVNIGAGESLALTQEIDETRRAEFLAELRNIESGTPLDSFPLDDRAYSVVAPPTSRRVYLVSEGNIFIERLLLLLPNLVPLRIVPDNQGDYRQPEDETGVYIFDGLVPWEGLPTSDLLFINPPENGLFEVSGEVEAVENAATTANPLVDQVVWDNVHVMKTRQIELPDWGQLLVGSDQTPLVFVGEQGGRRVAVVGFDLHNSDLPLQVGFPILFSQLAAYLAPPQSVERPNGSTPYETVAIHPGPGVERVTVTNPAGTPEVFETGGETIFFDGTAEPGIYQVDLDGSTGSSREAFSVNLFDPVESDIHVRDGITIGQRPVASAVANQVSDREVWGWLLGLALAFFLIEWLAYHQRLGLLRPKTG